MKTKFQLYLTAAISAAVIVLAGGLVLRGTSAAPAEASNVAAAQAQAESGAGRTITVVGQGKVEAEPDMAQANIGVEIVGPDVKQTSAEASQTMEAILSALQAQGVAEDDIQTSFFNVWVERPFNPQGSSGGGEVLYHVNNNVQVTIRDLEQVTTILGAAIEAGANNINSVNFNVSDPSQVRSEARKLAVDNALAKAQELADLNGVGVGEVVSVSEVIGGSPAFSELSAAGLGGGGGPILPGDVEISVQLQVTYAIQ